METVPRVAEVPSGAISTARFNIFHLHLPAARNFMKRSGKEGARMFLTTVNKKKRPVTWMTALTTLQCLSV